MHLMSTMIKQIFLQSNNISYQEGNIYDAVKTCKYIYSIHLIKLMVIVVMIVWQLDLKLPPPP